MTCYFNTAGRISILDLLGLPRPIPRGGRAVLNWFRQTIDETISARRKLIASGVTPPRDVLMLLLEMRDPETGQGMPEDVLRSNAVTFIDAGHENTANSLTWALYLLSQSHHWRDRVEAEVDAKLNAGPMETLVDRLPVTKAVIRPRRSSRTKSPARASSPA
ncbi:cytochrome P450 [Bradyrhizobium sp. 149]|nr:cytochrome P450 [Bradyrhizobium sp. 149]